MSTLLKDIPKSELPRERCLANGIESLSNEELLSILLRTGTKGQSVNELSREILSKIDNLNDLKDVRLSTLKSIKGLGTAKSVTVLAALELGKRIHSEPLVREKMKISNPVDAYRLFKKYIEDEKQENFLAIFLDNHKRYISHELIFKGTLNASLVSPREVFKMALLDDASGIIVLHNHPSGIATPSNADDETTARLVEVGNALGIPLLDHLIVGCENYYSYLEEGRLLHE